MMDWIKAIPGAVYDQGVEVVARHPIAAFRFILGLSVVAIVGWVF